MNLGHVSSNKSEKLPLTKSYFATGLNYFTPFHTHYLIVLSLSSFNLIYKAYYVLEQFKFDLGKLPHGARNIFPINAPGMGRFQLLNVGVLGLG